MRGGHYRANKMGEDGNELDRDHAGDKSGREVTFNTVKLGIRVEW